MKPGFGEDFTIALRRPISDQNRPSSDTDTPMLSPDELERYARHIVLKEIGGPGQQALKRARVLVIGAGGLGSPAALYLAAAGAGAIILADDDAVSLNNLQRQILFTTDEAGAPKAAAGAARLSALNPHVSVETISARLDAAGAMTAAKQADIVLDGSDNYETRFAVNAACHAAGKPLVSGAVERFSGQVAVFRSGLTRSAGAGERSPCYCCLVPDIPPDAETCAQIGVAGPAAGVIGSWMALEAIKLITGAGQPLDGRLAVFDGLAGTARTIALPPDPACPVCGQ